MTGPRLVNLVFKRRVRMPAISTAVLLLVLVFTGCRPKAAATPDGGPDPGITVTGEGKATGVPDVARVRLGVRVSDPVAQTAATQAAQQMAGLVAVIKQSGVAERDIRTQQLSVHFEEMPEPPRPEPPPAPARARTAPMTEASPAPPAEEPPSRGKYVVTNVVQVTVRDLSKLGALLGAATNAGANEVWGIDFEIDDPKPLEEKARAEAVANARAKAGALATLAGVTLGAPVAVREVGGGGMPVFEQAMSLSKADVAQVPIERGELTITTRVEMVYAIVQAR